MNKFNLSKLNTTNPVYIIQSRLSMDYVTIEGELENKSNLFIRYIKSSTIPIDDKITQVIKPIEPPNAIRGLSAACKLLIYLVFLIRSFLFLSISIYEISSSKYSGYCSCCLSTSFIC